MKCSKKLRAFQCLIMYAGIFFSNCAIAQQPHYEIYALKFGERTHKIPIQDAAAGAKVNDSLNVWFMYWLLRGNNGKLILVDAGFTDDSDINPVFITYTRPDLQLEKLGIKPDDITDIIITHPHWDHIGGIDLYPQARVWMQKDDYDYFTGEGWQADGNNGGFNKKDVIKVVQRNLEGLLTLVKGDDIEILPGIKVFTGSKHTFESQYAAVGEGNDKVILASDNAWFYYNIEHELPIPITFDTSAYTANLKRMKKMVIQTDHIIPGHDPLVFSKFPEVVPGIVNIKK